MKKLGKALRRDRLGYLMLLPTVLIVLLINIYPLFNSLYLTVHDVTLYNLNGDPPFVGLQNYVKLARDPDFISALGFTTLYTVAVVLSTYVLGMALALLVNREFRLRGGFRAFLLVPWILPTVVAALCWTWTFAGDGLANLLLMKLGVVKEPILFFADVFWAKVSSILLGIWKGFPFMTLTLLAGLQVIPADIYEAAAIDGSTPWRSLVHITLPLMKQVALVAVLLRFIWTFNNYEQVYLLTAGGPVKSTMTLAIYSYLMGFTRNELSYAATISVAMLLLLLLIYLFATARRRSADGFIQ